MKWTSGIKNKMTAAMLLLMVMAVVFVNNLNERRNSKLINDTLSELYADRLVVEGYIFQYSEHLHKVLDVLADVESNPEEKQSTIAGIKGEMNALSKAYAATKLTREEAGEFAELNRLCTTINRKAQKGEFEAIKQLAEEASGSLRTLSSIQISEATTLMGIADKRFSSGYLSSQFEMAVLVVIGMLLQGLIFASKTISVAPAANHRLN